MNSLNNPCSKWVNLFKTFLIVLSVVSVLSLKSTTNAYAIAPLPDELPYYIITTYSNGDQVAISSDVKLTVRGDTLLDNAMIVNAGENKLYYWIVGTDTNWRLINTNVSGYTIGRRDGINLCTFANYDVRVDSQNGDLYFPSNSYKEPFVGDSNYNLYKSGNYTGLLITNPFNGVDVKTKTVDIVAHARVPMGIVLQGAMFPNFNVFNNYEKVRKEVINIAYTNFQFFVNNINYDVIPIITLDDKKDNGFYNLTIKFSCFLKDIDNSLLLKSTFKCGQGIDNFNGTNLISYSDTISLKYVEFISVITTTTSNNGKTTTTTKTQANGIDYVESITVDDDGTKTTINNDGEEIIYPNGVIVYTPNPLTVIPSDDYLPLMEQIQVGFDRVTDLLVYGLHGFVSIPKILLQSITNVVTSFGDFVPFLTKIFSFLPEPANQLIITCFGFLALGVALRTFGRK